MGEIKSIGALEFSSIGVGMQAQDALLKAGDVRLLIARTICSGKYFVVFGGGVSEAQAALAAGTESGGEAVIDQWLCPNVHPSVFEALGQSVMLKEGQAQALGVLETFSGVCILAAADAAAKSARVTLFRIHVAMALGGKAYCMMTGTVGDVTAAVAAGAAEARERGLLVSEIVIPRPQPELFGEFI